jgi:hypothetical protein
MNVERYLESSVEEEEGDSSIVEFPVKARISEFHQNALPV